MSVVLPNILVSGLIVKVPPVTEPKVIVGLETDAVVNNEIDELVVKPVNVLDKSVPDDTVIFPLVRPIAVVNVGLSIFAFRFRAVCVGVKSFHHKQN